LVHGKYEKARIVGARALQISMGAPVLVNPPEGSSPLDVAIKEYEEDVIPITVIRRGENNGD